MALSVHPKPSTGIDLTSENLEKYKICLQFRESPFESKSLGKRNVYYVGISLPEKINETQFLRFFRMRFGSNLDNIAEINFDPKSNNGRSYISFEINQSMFETATIHFSYVSHDHTHDFTLKLPMFKNTHLVPIGEPPDYSFSCQFNKS